MLMEQEFPTHSLMRIENEIQVKHIFIDSKKNCQHNSFSIKKM